MIFLLNKKHIPNCLAILRITLVVPIILLLAVDTNRAYMIASFIWLIAGLTDALDGYLSRKWRVQSTTGALLDITADKILVLSVMIFLCYLQRIDPIIVILLMARDIYLSGLRAMAGSKDVFVSVRSLAKWKTAGQIMGMFLFLIGTGSAPIWPNSSFLLYLTGYFLLWVSVVLSWISAVHYTLDFKKKCL